MAASSSSRFFLRRALFYVPGMSEKMRTKAVTHFHADNVTFDLEDSVTVAAKEQARDDVRRHLSSLGQRPPQIRELAVRVNSIRGPYGEADIAAVAAEPVLDAVVLPKVDSAADLVTAAEMVRHHRARALREHDSSPSSEPSPDPIRLIALIESARAIVDLATICRAGTDGSLGEGVELSGLVFGAEDFARDLQISKGDSHHDLQYAQYARSATVTHACAFGIPSVIDNVYIAYAAGEYERGLEAECLNGRRLGFNGKQIIHPNQLGIANRVFGVSQNALDWAVRVIIAEGEAARQGRGAFTLDGYMIDAPIIGSARQVVEKARSFGLDVEGTMRRWSDQAVA